LPLAQVFTVNRDGERGVRGAELDEMLPPATQLDTLDPPGREAISTPLRAGVLNDVTT
jgi:hypothetical protein